VSHVIFEKFFDAVIIPAVIPNHGIDGCKGKPAIVFCDNCSAHFSDDILKKLDRYVIIVITYPAHVSHLFQVLDVLLFGILKRAKKCQRRNDMIRKEVDHALWLFQADEQVTVSTTTRASWNEPGFEYERHDNGTYLSLNEGKTY
jgi:hypothetical protein